MICIKCKQETPDTELYCTHCGMKMDITYDEITSKLHQDNKMEKERETEAFFRWLLVVSLTLFVTALVFGSLWSNPPLPDETPNYIPFYKEKPGIPDISEPIIIKEKNS